MIWLTLVTRGAQPSSAPLNDGDFLANGLDSSMETKMVSLVL